MLLNIEFSNFYGSTTTV